MTLERIRLDRTSWYDYDANWLGSAEQAELHAQLVRELDWQARPIRVFGREIMQPRLIAWAGGLPYRYSGQTLPPRPWTPALEALHARVFASTGVPYNHVLLNRYRDGRDHMGRHADDEPELGRDPTIAAVSLGVRRRFVIEPKRRGRRINVWLEPGSLLVMGGRMQHHYRHAVPKEDRLTEERINVTFRYLIRLPPRRYGPDADQNDAKIPISG